MANMMTYQPKLMASYCRLSSILELENFSTQQNVRETICNNETKTLKEKQARIASLQQNVDELWRVSRWVVDTLQACQDKNLNVGIPLTNLFKTDDWTEATSLRLSINSQCSDLSDRDFTDSPTSSTASDEFQLSKRTSSFNLKVYGTEEIGLSETAFTEVSINDKTTAHDVVVCAVSQFSNCSTNPSETVPAEEKSPESGAEESTDESVSSNGDSCNRILSSDNLENIALVVVAGSRERCLRGDLNLMKLQNPWEKGKLYLRLKKDALRATKWGLSTTV